MLEILRFFNHGYLARELLPVLDRDAVEMRFTRNNLGTHGLLRGKFGGIGEPRSRSNLSGGSGGCDGTCFSLFLGRVRLTVHIRLAKAGDGHFYAELFILLPVTFSLDSEGEFIGIASLFTALGAIQSRCLVLVYRGVSGRGGVELAV